VAVGVEPGDRNEQAARPDGPRIVGHAPDPDRGEGCRADRLAAVPRAVEPAVRGQPCDQLAQRARLGRLGGHQELGDRALGHRQRPSRRSARAAILPSR
jgi:hypothetical protein